VKDKVKKVSRGDKEGNITCKRSLRKKREEGGEKEMFGVGGQR